MLAQLLAPLIDVEEWILETLHSIGIGWGLAIVALTLLVRVSTLPLVLRQVRAQRELRAHMPELKRLRERHKQDPQRLQRETAAYYREHQIKPLAAFAPLLIQIPVFISLYYLMRTDVKSGLFGEDGFLFIPHLVSKPHGAVLMALLLSYLLAQLVSSADRDARNGRRAARPDADAAAAVRGHRGPRAGGPRRLLGHVGRLELRTAGGAVARHPQPVALLGERRQPELGAEFVGVVQTRERLGRGLDAERVGERAPAVDAKLPDHQAIGRHAAP